MEACNCDSLGLLDILLNTKCYIECFIKEHGTLTYLLIALIIFCETGLVATPFLPGDSLLFTAGMLAAIPANGLNVWIIIPLLIFAALLGDNVNYLIGNKLGTRVFEIKWLKKIVKREYLNKTEKYFEKHGGKTIIMARFIPFVRTFAPFSAGLGSMKYGRYLVYSIFGAVLWVSLLSLAGFFLGQNEWIRSNYEKVILGIIAISLLPVIFGLLKSLFAKK